MPGKQMAVDADLNAGTIGEGRAGAAPRRGSRLLRLHGRCVQIRARRRHRGHPSSLLIQHRRLHGRRAGARPERRPDGRTYPAGHRRRLVAQIAGAADLGGGGDGGLARRQGERTTSAGRSFLQPGAGVAARAGISATILGMLGVIPGMPNCRSWASPGIVGYRRLAWVAKRPPEPAGRRRAAPAGFAPATPAGTTCARSTSSAWNWATG